MESSSLSIKTIGELYQIDGKQLQVQYKHHISSFESWEQLNHADEYVLFKQNIGERISMDETCLSQGELYTIITNKSARGGKGAMIAMIRGTKSEVVLHYLNLLPRSLRLQVKEITIDLSPSMKLIAKSAFPNATIVSDHFHVQKLINEAISDLRVDYRWQAIDMENAEIQLAREVGRTFKPHFFENGVTRRQLLARSRHIVMKHYSKWTASQRERAQILFEQYPALQEAYDISMELTQIYNRRDITDKGVALLLFAKWYDKVERMDCKFFNSVINTMQNNYATIANYFVNRSTNAAAESFNAKVKAFRAQFRGVRDIPFFIFRLTKLSA